MDILNFISWIRGRRQVTSVDPAKSLLPVALKDGRRDDEYLTGAISVEDFTAQVASVIPSGAQGPQGPQGVPGPVGPAGLNWQGSWSALGTYVADDAVGYAGASWFCIDPVGPSVTPPNADLTNWALLASQGATGSQGPQGIQGVQGPSGSGTPGTIVGQSDYWNGTTWTPTFGLSINPSTGVLGTARIGIGLTTLNTTGYALSMATNSGGIRIAQTQSGGSVYNLWTTPATAFQFGLNPPAPGNPVFDNSVYFTQNGSNAIKFATGFNTGGGDRLLIQGNGQVTIGSTQATNTTANLVVKTADIETEGLGSGLIVASPDGTRYRISVANGGLLTVVGV
jgi:hypothetical protein